MSGLILFAQSFGVLWLLPLQSYWAASPLLLMSTVLVSLFLYSSASGFFDTFMFPWYTLRPLLFSSFSPPIPMSSPITALKCYPFLWAQGAAGSAGESLSAWSTPQAGRTLQALPFSETS